MTYRIGWLSPLTPTSGIGTFSDAITRHFPCAVDGEPVDLTILYVGHEKLYRSGHRSVEIGDGEGFRGVLTLFDLLIYNMGNNLEHHAPIFALLRLYPGLVICHDHVYQQFFAGLSLRAGKSLASFAGLFLTYGGATASECLVRSRVTSRLGQARYKPWDGEATVRQPLDQPIMALGSALVVHSSFAQRHAERHFTGPVLRLGMPHDQKPSRASADLCAWPRQLVDKQCFELVSIGHIQTTKCLDLVIAAIAASPILRHRIHYTIAGYVCDVAYLDRLKSMVAAHALHDCVSFAGELSDRRLGELTAHADIFVNLRRPNTEGASVSLIEQLDTGKPVVVIGSGCYADIPADAAIRVPADADVATIRVAFERLVDDPASMPTIGRAGRAYARSWTCEAYATQLLRFVFTNRALLERRAKVSAIPARASSSALGTESRDTHSDAAIDAAWAFDLARARLKLTYLDRNLLAVDPALILEKSSEALAAHVANILFGIFGNAALDRALSRFFARLEPRTTYWASVRFAVLADAVFTEDESACARLIDMPPCHDTEFWAVIEALPARQCLAAAMLILARRSPTPEEIAMTGLDDVDGFPKRLRMAELVRALEPAPTTALARLGAWLDTPCVPALKSCPIMIETDFDCAVGSPDFAARVDLSGFYGMEADHAWTRGLQGFLGLRLGGGPVDVDVLVRPICASPTQPATMRLSYDADETAIETRDCTPLWLSISIAPAAAAIRWVRLATDVTAVPGSSADTRPLGLCCLRLRVRVASGSTDARSLRRPFEPGDTDLFSGA